MSQTITRKKTSPPKNVAPEKPPRPQETHRETVESIVVAFILALLVRGFEAEAFVIPTGSMAPTLMGRHKEVACPQCSNVYAVSASEEEEAPPLRGNKQIRVEYGTCGNCRFQARIDDTPSFKGDRILVMKFLYDLSFLPGASPPQRWDVVVFKYPENPETNFIKRLVGLPDEEVRIQHGNIFTRPRGSSPETPFHLQRKPLVHQQAMQMLVYDDRHRPKAMANDLRWQRWKPATPWQEKTPGHFEASASPSQEWSELRYHNLVPDHQQWEAAIEGQPLPQPPRPTLVSDFYAYNTGLTANYGGDVSLDKAHWVGDLSLSLRLEVPESQANQGLVRLELVEGGIPNHCEIDLRNGQAVLFHGSKRLGEASTSIQGPGTYALEFANFDDRLTLWVNGRTPFGAGVDYDDGPDTCCPAPTNADLQPAAVACRGASVRVSDLVLKRDIYYTQKPGDADYVLPWDRYSYDADPRANRWFELLADPSRYAKLPMAAPLDYPLHSGNYLMMGDNSPKSKDGRGWDHNDRRWDSSGREDWELPESLLIGKAFFVYWPHGKPFGPDVRVNRDFRVPFRPYVERMKLIR